MRNYAEIHNLIRSKLGQKNGVPRPLVILCECKKLSTQGLELTLPVWSTKRSGHILILWPITFAQRLTAIRNYDLVGCSENLLDFQGEGVTWDKQVVIHGSESSVP